MGNETALSSRFTMPWGEEYSGATLVTCTWPSWPPTPGTWPEPPDSSTGWTLPRLPALDGARAMIKPQYRNMVELGALRGGGGAASGADDWNVSPPSWTRPRASLGR